MKNIITILVMVLVLPQLPAETFFEKFEIDISDYREHKAENEDYIFFDRDRDILNIFRIPHPSDMPDPRLRKEFTEVFHKQTEQSDARLVEAKGIYLDDNAWVGYILNAFPQDPTGYTYQVTIILPTAEESIMLQVNCVERGTTGIRESTVWAKESLEMEGKKEYSLVTTWDKKYDELFPDHPLSRARKKAKKIIESIDLNDETLKIVLYPNK